MNNQSLPQNKQNKLDVLYLRMAKVWSENSHCKRSQVGCLIVKDRQIISDGYNGTPSGWDNNCEDIKVNNDGDYVTVTKPEVLHAETNAIAKLAKFNGSGSGSVLFVTHAPCLDCSKLVFQSGISSVFYRNSYRDNAGVDFLNKAGVKVEQI